MTQTATAADHAAYANGTGSTTFLVARECAEENWQQENGRLAETDAETDEVTAWALLYITEGVATVYEDDEQLARIAGSAL